MATYPDNLASFTTKTNKVDLVDASHINSLQDEVVAIEGELGVAVAGGTHPDLVTRLSYMMDNDGSVKSSNAFPTSTYPSQLFFRTDLDTTYIRNAANTAWITLGGSTSNLLFNYNAATQIQGTAGELSQQTTLSAILGATGYYRYYKNPCSGGVGNFNTVWHTRWTKITGVNTIITHAQIWSTNFGGSNRAQYRITVGTVATTASGTAAQGTPEWVTSPSLDVSGLTNGTTYNVVFEVGNFESPTGMTYSGTVLGFGS